jgi:hypothetical protein
VAIHVELSPEAEAHLTAEAAARSMELPAYAAVLLEEAARPSTPEPQNAGTKLNGKRLAGRKSLAQLFAESPFRGLDLDFERDADSGRDMVL